MEELLTRKAVNFDLNTNVMKGIFDNYTDGYGKIRRSMKANDFEHRQGSGYVSKEKLNSVGVAKAISNVVKDNPWLGDCVKKIDVTDIGNQYDLTDFVHICAERTKGTAANEEETQTSRKSGDQVFGQDVHYDVPGAAEERARSDNLVAAVAGTNDMTLSWREFITQSQTPEKKPVVHEGAMSQDWADFYKSGTKVNAAEDVASKQRSKVSKTGNVMD